MFACRRALDELLVGVDQDRELFPRLHPDTAEAHRERPIATGWYPEKYAAEVVEVAASVLGRPPHEVAHEVGRRSMTHQYGGIGMAIASVLVTPRLTVKYSASNWRKYRNNGRLLSTMIEPGLIRSEIVEWRGHAPSLCRGTWGALEEIWNNMRRVKTSTIRRTSCVTSGDASCVFEIRYTT